MTLQLVVENLELKRGARTILAGLSLVVGAGEALVLTGANGAGKTTLIRALAGLLAPSAGTIRLAGGDAERPVAEQCHYVGHANGLKASFTAAENLRFWAAFLADGDQPGARPAATVADALDRVGLGALADIPAGYLSAGQKRRLGLARLLVAHRPVWLLDEPTVSLDAASVAMLAKIIDAHVAAGGIAVAATHLNLGLARTRDLRLGPSATPAAA